MPITENTDRKILGSKLEKSATYLDYAEKVIAEPKELIRIVMFFDNR